MQPFVVVVKIYRLWRLCVFIDRLEWKFFFSVGARENSIELFDDVSLEYFESNVFVVELDFQKKNEGMV